MGAILFSHPILLTVILLIVLVLAVLIFYFRHLITADFERSKANTALHQAAGAEAAGNQPERLAQLQKAEIAKQKMLSAEEKVNPTPAGIATVSKPLDNVTSTPGAKPAK
jgi:ABC-type uncharacterized transport system YnjBCD ATPase subunit